LAHTHTPPELRGRVMGVYLMKRGLVPLGSLVIGALATAMGAPNAVALMGEHLRRARGVGVHLAAPDPCAQL